MSATAVTLSRPVKVETPSWTVVILVLVGITGTVLTALGGMFLGMGLALLVAAGGFVGVLKYRHIGIMVFLSTFLIMYPPSLRGIGPLTINNVLGAAFAGILVWDFFSTQDAWYMNDPLIRVLCFIGFLFLAGTVISNYTLPDNYIQSRITKPLGATYQRTDYTGRFLFQFFSRLAFAIFIGKFVKTPRQLWWVWLALLACIMAAVPPSLLLYLRTHGEDVRALSKSVGWADNANRFAFGCLVGVAIAYYNFATTRSLLLKLVMLGCAGLLLPLVLLSASRSGFLGMFLLGFFALSGQVGGERMSRGMLFTTIIAGVILSTVTFFVILTPSMRERLLNLNPFNQGSAEGYKSTQFREATLKDSIQIMKMHPIMGVGLGNFRWVHKYYFMMFKPPHNSYVWAMSEGGPPLLLTYLGFFAMLWRRIARVRRPFANHPEIPYLGHLLRVYFTLFLFFSMFADVWLEEHIFMLVGTVMLLDRWIAEAQATAVLAPSGSAPATPGGFVWPTSGPTAAAGNGGDYEARPPALPPARRLADRLEEQRRRLELPSLAPAPHSAS